MVIEFANGRSYEVAEKPTEGKVFKVDPRSINRKLFEEKIADSEKEQTRKFILQAFAQMEANPEKHAKVFYTMIPKKTWEWKTIADLKELATVLGDHNAKFDEQALEWAQRISNGESWENICNEPDTANSQRLVEWKNGCSRVVGGGREVYNNKYTATSVSGDYHYPESRIHDTVPLVVLYEE